MSFLSMSVMSACLRKFICGKHCICLFCFIEYGTHANRFLTHAEVNDTEFTNHENRRLKIITRKKMNESQDTSRLLCTRLSATV